MDDVTPDTIRAATAAAAARVLDHVSDEVIERGDQAADALTEYGLAMLRAGMPIDHAAIQLGGLGIEVFMHRILPTVAIEFVMGEPDADPE